MFEALLKPYLIKQYPCTTELIRSTTNKHKRIIDTLEPLLTQHRLVIDAKVIKADYEETNSIYSTERALRYQLMYQMSRIQYGANTLVQDDRLDALQMCCNYWIEHLAKDQDIAVKQRKDELVMQELEKFYNVPNQNTWI